mmetsp:Transcript_121871/g.339807  ORF Transcript_121871/g.339807 Transcript_121871/m.339807 type:complete len:226 (-) Transcript_121871:270-947(-)
MRVRAAWAHVQLQRGVPQVREGPPEALALFLGLYGLIEVPPQFPHLGLRVAQLHPALEGRLKLAQARLLLHQHAKCLEVREADAPHGCRIGLKEEQAHDLLLLPRARRELEVLERLRDLGEREAAHFLLVECLEVQGQLLGAPGLLRVPLLAQEPDEGLEAECGAIDLSCCPEFRLVTLPLRKLAGEEAHLLEEQPRAAVREDGGLDLRAAVAPEAVVQLHQLRL